MADDPAGQPTAATLVPRFRDQQYRELYANSTLMGITPVDLSIVFQKTSELLPNQNGVTDLVSVTLSPQHFKAFLRAATESLKAYESVFGSLTIPEEDTAPMRDAGTIEGVIRDARVAAHAMRANPSSTEKKPRGN